MTVASVVQSLSSAYEDVNVMSTRLFELLESEHSNEQLQNEVRVHIDKGFIYMDGRAMHGRCEWL